MGAPKDIVAAAESNKEDVLFEVFSDCAEPVMIFLKMSTQWRIIAGFSGALYLGLDYTALDFLLKIEKVKDCAAVFADIQLMERAALTQLNLEKK